MSHELNQDCDKNSYQNRTVSPAFIGRLSELNNIKEYIVNFMLDTDGNALQIIQITGPPAIGKTLLAKQVSREMEMDCIENGHPLRSHFIDLQKETRMSNVLKQIASEFSSTHDTGEKLVRELVLRPDNNTLELLVLDGIEDLLNTDESCGAFLEFCEEFLKVTLAKTNYTKVFLLLTSTVKFQLPRSASKLYTINLSPLTLCESKEGLLNNFGNVDFEAHLDNLAECSVGFPIAIILIGTILRLGHVSPKELVDRLRRDWIATLINGDYKKTMARVKSVIKVCLDGLPITLRQDYAKLAYIPASFTVETAQYITSTSSLQTSVAPSTAVVKHDLLWPLYERSLIEIYHLLDPISKRERFNIHQFLRSFVENKYNLLDHELHEVRNRYCVFYGRLLLNIVPLLEGNYAAHLTVFTIEIRNVEKLLREAIHCLGDNTELFLDVAYTSNALIETFLPTEEAVEFYKACVNATQSKQRPGGINKLSEARMLLVYGKMLGAAKTDFELEHEQYMKAMRLLKPRGDCMEMVLLLYSIAGNLHSRGRRIEAMKKLHEVLAILDRLENRSSKSSLIPRPLVAISPNISLEPEMALSIQRSRANATYLLGVICAWIGKTKEAEKYHLISLKIKRQLWGENHPSIGVGYNGLSLVYEKTGEQNKAVRFCFLGLDVKQRFFKEPSISMIVSLSNAARHLSQQKGEHERALRLLDKAYRMRERLGLNHRDTALIYNNRGKIYFWMGDYKNAITNFETAVRLRRKYIGVHASTAGSMHLLGKSYLKNGQHRHAVETLSACIHMLEETHMKEQPLSEQRADTLEPLAAAYHGVEKYDRAVEFYHRTIVEFKRLSDEFGRRGQIIEQSTFDRKIDDVQQKLDAIRKDLNPHVTIFERVFELF